MTDTENLVRRLRTKVSRDNRALLDEAADAIEERAQGCPCCRGEQKLMDNMIQRLEVAAFPVPHLRMTVGEEIFGITIKYCPMCGRELEENHARSNT